MRLTSQRVAKRTLSIIKSGTASNSDLGQLRLARLMDSSEVSSKRPLVDMKLRVAPLKARLGLPNAIFHCFKMIVAC